MDNGSVTRPASPTLAIVADEAFCAQVAAVLMCDQEPIRKVFIGEPAEEVLTMGRWAVSHEEDEGFDVEKVLTTWAQKCERGTWSTRPAKSSLTRRNLNGKLAEELVRFWSENSHELVAILDQVEENLNGNGRS